jgi:hypothetical protein
VFYGLNIHYLLFFIGYLVRYTRHKGLGIINLNDPRPLTYKLKILLQAIIGIATLGMAVDFCQTDSGTLEFDPLGLIYVFYAGIWVLGIHLQYFEYKRNIPHAWYTHQMFWLLSSLVNLTIMAAIILLLKIYNFENNLAMKIKYLACHGVYILVSIALTYMGFKYKREHP